MELNLHELNVRSCKNIFYYEFPKESQLAFNLLEMPRKYLSRKVTKREQNEQGRVQEEVKITLSERYIECLESILPMMHGTKKHGPYI